MSNKMDHRLREFPTQQIHATSVTPYCATLHHSQLAAVRGKIYAIGGWDDNHEYLDTVEEYDTIRYVCWGAIQ